MVRKKLEPNERLSEVLSLKVTPPDRDAWRAKVAASGKSASEFFREAILHNQTTIVEAPRVDLERVAFLRVYAGLSARVEALIDQAATERERGLIDGTAYLNLLSGLAVVTEVFRTELNRVG